MIKCIGCLKLVREEMTRANLGREVYYNCPDIFPYMTSIGGLLHPGKGLEEAVRKDCSEQIGEHCILCDKPGKPYGREIVFMCQDHDRAWGKWLDEHPDRRAYLSPGGHRVKQANWIEVFREFIEEARENVRDS